jgi:hypothetical protein
MRILSSGAVAWAAGLALCLQPFAADASSVGPYGVARQKTRVPPVGGRPVTYSEADIFACIDRKGAGEIYRVPAYYVTDQTSIPKELMPFIDLGGTHPLFADAAIVHDYLYAVGKPGDRIRQELADEAMVILARAERLSGLAIKEISGAFFVARQIGGTYGKDDEWRRWIHPHDLEYVVPGMRPTRKRDSAHILSVKNCAVFDAHRQPVSTPAYRRSLKLHACLHHRHRSDQDRTLWATVRPLEPTRMPTSLKSASSGPEVADYRARADRCAGLAA